MNKKKLLHKLQAFFDADIHKKRHHIAAVKKILKKLKKKERKIAEQMLETSDGILLKNYQTDLNIIHAQRKKGIEVLQQLKRT